MPFFILSLIVQVALVVHVLKTGRNTTWVFILLFAPLIGTLAYIIVELLPEFGASRTAHQARRKLGNTINPNRDLHEATDRIAVADTAKNALILGEEYLERSRFAEARDLYQRHLKGIHDDDPQLMLGLARAQFGLGEFAAAEQTLDLLKEKNPTHRSAEGHLLYARIQEALGKPEAAIHEYEALRRYFPGPEATCRMATLLKAAGRTEQAHELFRKVLDESRVAGKHYNSINREWVALARREAEVS